VESHETNYIALYLWQPHSGKSVQKHLDH